MPATIDRHAYAHMFGPTTGDRVRLADTDLILEVEEDRTIYGEEVKFGGGKVIRDGMGQSQTSRGARRGRHRHHQRPDRRRGGHRQGRHRHQGRPHRRHRQGRQSRRAAGRRHRHRPRHRGDRRREAHRHRRRHRCAHPLDLPATGGRRALFRDHHHARRRHRPRRRHQCDDLHARPLAHRPHAAGGRRPAAQHRPVRQGQRLAAGSADRAGGGRRLRPQAARGLGNDARRHRYLPHRRRPDRRAGGDPHRYPERVRVRRAHHRRLQGPHHPCLPHRGCRRRPCARHHQGLRPRQRPAVVDQSDPALYGQHARRAPRHADGLPSPRCRHSGGRGLRREPHPPRDDCCGGHPSRPRRASP